MLSGQQMGTTDTPKTDEFINVVWPIELFPTTEPDRKNYGLSPYVFASFLPEEEGKEKEWIRLVGFDFYTLSEEKKRFLLQTAGAIRFEQKIDIKEVYNTSIY